MVALKLEIGDGIAHIPAKKQERRGGIETLARSGGEPPASGGSRNAVVALKHDPRGDPHHHRTPKQERRGGIETGNGIRKPDVGFVKQERRGGIETRS